MLHVHRSKLSREPKVPIRAVHWRRLFGYLKPYRGRMALAIAAERKFPFGRKRKDILRARPAAT